MKVASLGLHERRGPGPCEQPLSALVTCRMHTFLGKAVPSLHVLSVRLLLSTHHVLDTFLGAGGILLIEVGKKLTLREEDSHSKNSKESKMS